MLFVRRSKYVKIGQITGIYMIWYGVGRFFIEASRTDSLILLGFKVAQLVSIIMIIVGIVLFILGVRKGKYEDLYNEVK